MSKQAARQRQPQQQQQQQQVQAEGAADGFDAAKAARTQRLVLQTSLVVAAALVAAYFGVISEKWALGIMVMMSLCLRFFAF